MKDHDKNVQSKYIMHPDSNNLYGWAMSPHLPTGGFRWLNDSEIADIDKHTEDGEKGIMLEVDLEYPKELHDNHNSYPVAPEKVKVSKNMLSEYCKKIARRYNITIGQVKN